MRADLKLTAIVLAIAGLLWTSPTRAGGERRIALEPGGAVQGATAEAVIADGSGSQKEVVITASGLPPAAVYTAWLVNMEPKMDMAGLGTGDYSFRSDDDGAARYVATISTAALETWQMLEIAYHPSGNPENMHEMMDNIAFKGKLGN